MQRTLTLLAICFATIMTSTGCNLAGRRCNECSGPVGCRPCNLGWQRGGTDYQRCLGNNHCGGGRACNGGGLGSGIAAAGSAMMGVHTQFDNAQPAGAGEAYGDPTAQVAYPYYTTRGPRDFFLDNPPTIGR